MLLADRIADTEPTAIRTHLGAIFVSLELNPQQRLTVDLVSLRPPPAFDLVDHFAVAGQRRKDVEARR